MQPKPTSLKVYRVIVEKDDEDHGWKEYRVLLTTFNESEANERGRKFNDTKSNMWPECRADTRAVVQSTEILIVGWS